MEARKQGGGKEGSRVAGKYRSKGADKREDVKQGKEVWTHGRTAALEGWTVRFQFQPIKLDMNLPSDLHFTSVFTINRERRGMEPLYQVAMI